MVPAARVALSSSCRNSGLPPDRGRGSTSRAGAAASPRLRRQQLDHLLLGERVGTQRHGGRAGGRCEPGVSLRRVTQISQGRSATSRQIWSTGHADASSIQCTSSMTTASRSAAAWSRARPSPRAASPGGTRGASCCHLRGRRACRGRAATPSSGSHGRQLRARCSTHVRQPAARCPRAIASRAARAACSSHQNGAYGVDRLVQVAGDVQPADRRPTCAASSIRRLLPMPGSPTISMIGLLRCSAARRRLGERGDLAVASDQRQFVAAGARPAPSGRADHRRLHRVALALT